MYEPKKNKNYPKSGPDPGHLNIMNCSPDKLIGFALGRHPAMLWHDYGSDQADRNGPPNWNHSIRYMGWMNVGAVGPDLNNFAIWV